MEGGSREGIWSELHVILSEDSISWKGNRELESCDERSVGRRTAWRIASGESAGRRAISENVALLEA